MPFVKGKSGNPSGRSKGATNKTSNRVKALCEKLITSNYSQIEKEFKGLTGKEKLNAFTALLPYVLPKLQSTTLDDNSDKTLEKKINDLSVTQLKALLKIQSSLEKKNDRSTNQHTERTTLQKVI